MCPCQGHIVSSIPYLHLHYLYEVSWSRTKKKVAVAHIVRVRPVVCIVIHTTDDQSIIHSPLVPEGCRYSIQAMAAVVHHKLMLKPLCGGPGFFGEGAHSSLSFMPWSRVQCREIRKEWSLPRTLIIKTPGRSLTPFFQKNGEEAQLLVNVADKERCNNHPAGSTQQYPAVEHDILRNRTNSVYGDVRFLILNVLLNNNFSDIQQHNTT